MSDRPPSIEYEPRRDAPAATTRTQQPAFVIALLPLLVDVILYNALERAVSGGGFPPKAFFLFVWFLGLAGAIVGIIFAARALRGHRLVTIFSAIVMALHIVVAGACALWFVATAIGFRL